MTVEDPIINLGGGANGAAPTTNDGKDRGTELQYYTSEAILGIYGLGQLRRRVYFRSRRSKRIRSYHS